MSTSRRPRVIKPIAAFVGIALVISACGGGGETGSPGASVGGATGTPGLTDGAPSGSPGELEQIGGTVSVVGSWTGSEQESFMAMVAPFEQMTGVTVEYTGSRDLAAQLTTGVQSGALPDVAGLPGPGLMREWYGQGALKPLDFVDLDAYKGVTPAGYADLGVTDDGTLIGIFVKSAVKGLIWYSTKNWTGAAPVTWEELTSSAGSQASGATKTWCIGLESGAASGWPATDWIEDIVLRQAGPDVYDEWVAGTRTWSSPEIRQAFETFGDAVDQSYGGTDYVLSTNFGDAANPMFETPPGCLLHHQASFITDFFQKQAGATAADYDFFPFPDINAQYAGSVVGAGDLFGMFNATPQAQALIRWLLTADAQEIWVARGGALSGNRDVPLSAYPDDASQRSAEILQNAMTFRFDASDQMPNVMNDAFFRATLDFVQDQSELDAILTRLDAVQADAYAE